ncbi:MAG TPA: nucleoside phosphorylase [Flavihumibacter sp.]|nr:nucleoside phosphorylase [Bacteroidota bacterium]HPZ88047.1 nucleoside phosphorylase [Flavihumibacter sp.]HQD09363.1 nucleoside phosphorylase [Flavihumibacter sp.]
MKPIAPSELIINPRGAVYHIDLRPDELADTVITVGDPGRVAVVSKYFDRLECSREHREFVAHTGYIGKKRLTVLSSGIGPDNIDIVLNELDALVNIDFETRTIKDELRSLAIIRLGTCGSLQADIPVDSLVAGTYGLGLDNLLHFYRQETSDADQQIIQAFLTQTQLHSQSQPYIAAASPALLKHFVNGFHQGITVTCPGFYGPQGRVLRLGLQHPELVNRLTSFEFGPHRIANFEMETSAIYGLGKLLGHYCLSLNVVVANRVARAFSADSQKAVGNLIEKALETIEHL